MKAKLIIFDNPIIEINGIISSKQIDYNGIDFGVVDVEKLAKEAATSLSKLDLLYANGFYGGFIEDFKSSQQLNEKKFSEADLRKAIEMAQKESWDEGGYLGLEYEPSQIIASVSLPKTFEIEIEETDTTIKIIKKL